MKFSVKVSRGFSLIEMLVAFALILILVAIIVPVVGGVRQRAESSNCVANLRGLGAAIRLYAEEHQYRLPGPVWVGIEFECIPKADGVYQSLTGYLVPYMDCYLLGDQATYRFPGAICPSLQKRNPENLRHYRTAPQSPFGREINQAFTPTATFLSAEDEFRKPLSSIYAIFDNCHPEPPAHMGGRNYLMLDGSVRWESGDQFGPP